MTPSNIEQILTETFAPAIDARAPYAKVMFQKAALEIARAYGAEIDPLRSALRPFASLGAKIHAEAPDSAALVLTTLDGGIIDTHNRVTVGDLRRAIAATA